MQRLIVLVALLALFLPAAGAADQTVELPVGWQVSPTWVAASSNGVALVLFPTGADPFDAGSRVFFIRPSGATQTTDVPGKAYYLAFSPTGPHLLVHHEDASGPHCSLLDGVTGAVLWTKHERSLFQFSGDGTRIFAQEIRSEMGLRGPRVEVFDLAGRSLLRISLDRDYSDIALFDAERFVLGFQHKLVAYVPGEPLVQQWALDLTHPKELIERLRVLDRDRLIVTQMVGAFHVVGRTGTVLYSYDPAALDASDPNRSFRDYANYTPFRTPLPNKLLLFNGTEDALVLDLLTGVLTGKRLDLSVAPGFTPIDTTEDGKLVFYSERSVRVRTLPF